MDAEIRLGCLKLAADLAKPSGDYSPERVVNIANVLYTFCQASPPPETVEDIADKPKRGRSSKVDILS